MNRPQRGSETGADVISSGLRVGRDEQLRSAGYAVEYVGRDTPWPIYGASEVPLRESGPKDSQPRGRRGARTLYYFVGFVVIARFGRLGALNDVGVVGAG